MNENQRSPDSNDNVSDNCSALAGRIQAFRMKSSLSRSEFAARLHVSPTTVLRWETGTSKPTRATAHKLEELGFPPLVDSETKMTSTPRLTLIASQSESDPKSIATHLRKQLDGKLRSKMAIGTIEYAFEPAPYVLNGPEDQLDFFNFLYDIQSKPKSTEAEDAFARRLSSVAYLQEILTPPSQAALENSKKTAKHWNPNYGSHGWHRYIGRFPPQLVRALMNHFRGTGDEVVLDPFCGSGTTLVEARLLGHKAIGIDICPLSCLISRTKSQFPYDGTSIQASLNELTSFYEEKWDEFTRGKTVDEIPHEEIISREGNLILEFPNYMKWLTPKALLGTSIVVEFLSSIDGYYRDSIACALSSAMRSVGNVDVDVVRAEYSKQPRKDVDVLGLVTRVLTKMVRDTERMNSTHADIMCSSSDIDVIEGSVLEANVPAESIDFVITSPPYGVESISYLRTHLLSYRCLFPILKHDPYEFNDKIIGSEYLSSNGHLCNHKISPKVSRTFTEFFDEASSSAETKQEISRVNMMMKFFSDMDEYSRLMKKWLRPGGRIAFVVGNKRLGQHVIPTDTIIEEIFSHYSLNLDRSYSHKLKCNNSNSEVPWQERTIQSDSIMIFTKEE